MFLKITTCLDQMFIIIRWLYLQKQSQSSNTARHNQLRIMFAVGGTCCVRTAYHMSVIITEFSNEWYHT
jgi:hypothetical protein